MVFIKSILKKIFVFNIDLSRKKVRFQSSKKDYHLILISKLFELIESNDNDTNSLAYHLNCNFQMICCFFVGIVWDMSQVTIVEPFVITA